MINLGWRIVGWRVRGWPKGATGLVGYAEIDLDHMWQRKVGPFLFVYRTHVPIEYRTRFIRVTYMARNPRDSWSLCLGLP